MKNLEMMKMQIESLETIYKKSLESRLNSLIKSLQIELNDLKMNPNYRPNSCGLIQGEANRIDELCVKLGTLDAIKSWH